MGSKLWSSSASCASWGIVHKGPPWTGEGSGQGAASPGMAPSPESRTYCLAVTPSCFHPPSILNSHPCFLRGQGYALAQWSSSGGSFAPRGHRTVAAHISGYRWGTEATGISWVEARGAARHGPAQRMVPRAHSRLPCTRGQSCQVKKPCLSSFVPGWWSF